MDPSADIQLTESQRRTLVGQVVSLHCNLDENTRHLMNKERLNLMKKDALLVNASRGPVVDEVALVNHLKANPDFRQASLRFLLLSTGRQCLVLDSWQQCAGSLLSSPAEIFLSSPAKSVL